MSSHPRRAELLGKYACRLCRHDQYDHNLTEGCPHCRCMATWGEAGARTDEEMDYLILSPGQYAKGYEPPPPTPEPEPIEIEVVEGYYEIQYRPTPGDGETRKVEWDWQNNRVEFLTAEAAWEWVDHLTEANEGDIEFRVVEVEFRVVSREEAT